MLLICFWWFGNSYNERNINQSIDSAARVFERYLGERQKLLATASEILTADYGFKKAVATRDQATISSALENLGGRIQADLMLITDIDGGLISSSPESFSAFDELLLAERFLISNPGQANFAVFDGVLYQMILQPVRSPRIVAYTLVGFKIQESVARELKKLTGLEISFYARNNQLFASSLSLGRATKLEEFLSARATSFFFSDRDIYISREVSLDAVGAEPILAVISADLRPSYKEFDGLILTVIWMTGLVVLVGLFASVWFGNRLTVPLTELVATARRFAHGDYNSQVTNLETNYEVKALADAFYDMGQEIQCREQQVLFQAHHDPLTELYNRNFMLSAFDDERENNNHFLVITMNLRGFRSINDNLGSLIGDQCLQAIATRMREFDNSGKVVNGRLGGDEFVSLITLTAVDEVLPLCEKYHQYLSRPLQIGDLSLTLKFSYGVCVYPEDATDPKAILRRSIIALEEGRKEGVVIRRYKAGEDEAHLERLQLIEDLKQALNANDGQLFMCFQPKMKLATGTIEKVESLIRWRKPDGQWVSPEYFIGLAEQAGLIVEVTQWVVFSVVKQLHQWQCDGLFVKAAINVSAQDVSHPDFYSFMLDITNKFSVEAKFITLELTERDLMNDEAGGIERLQALKSLGFTLSVDDYGIGQSSLSKLKKMPVDELKIDKSFILKLNKSDTDQMIVQSTITLGHNLGLSVVAEGVENNESLMLLKSMGCDHIQGYYLSKPIPAIEFQSWLKEYEKSLLRA